MSSQEDSSNPSSNNLNLEEEITIPDRLVEGLPVRGVADGLLLFDVDELVGWSEEVASYFITQGSSNQIRYFEPRVRALENVIDEKDIVIEAQRQTIRALRTEIGDIRLGAVVYRRRAEEAEARADTWRNRFWVSVGVSTGVVVVAGTTAWLLLR